MSTHMCGTMQVSQMLPLQLWDGEYGALNILPATFNREVLCKTFTVAALGVLQPFLLLLAGFLCNHALRCVLSASQHCQRCTKDTQISCTYFIFHVAAAVSVWVPQMPV